MMTSVVQIPLVRTAVGSPNFLTAIRTVLRGARAGLKMPYLLRSSRAGVVSADSTDIRDWISQKRTQNVLPQARPNLRLPSLRENATTAGRRVIGKQSVTRRNGTQNLRKSARNQELPKK